MNMKLIRGYAMAILGLLVLVATGILLLNNLGGKWEMQFFWKPVTLSPAAGMLLAGMSGIIVWYTVIKLLPMAFKTLRKGKNLQQTKNNQQRLKELEKQKDNSPTE